MPQATSVPTRFFGTFRQRHNEEPRIAAGGYRQVLKTAEEGVARLKTLRLKALAIPAIYGSSGRYPTLRLGVQDRSLRAKIRFWLQRIHRLKLRLFNCNAVASLATAGA